MSDFIDFDTGELITEKQAKEIEMLEEYFEFEIPVGKIEKYKDIRRDIENIKLEDYDLPWEVENG